MTIVHPSGLFLIENFITETQEEILIKFVDENISKTDSMKHRRVLHYGYEFRYDINNVDKNNPSRENIPQECNFIYEKLLKSLPTNCESYIRNFQADQLTINDYQSGQGIPPHIDTHSAFEDPIISLSLSSDIVMDFRNGDVHIPLLLPRRSLLIMSGESRCRV